MPVIFTEYAGVSSNLRGVIPVYDGKQKVTRQNIAVGSASATLNVRTTLVSVKATEECRIEWGVSAEASTTTEHLSAGERIDIIVPKSSGWIFDTNAAS